VPSCVVMYDYVFNTADLKIVLAEIYKKLAEDGMMLFLLVNMDEVFRNVMGFDDVVDDDDDGFIEDVFDRVWDDRDARASRDARDDRHRDRRAYSAQWVEVSTYY
jgi:hypothetical protein